MTPSSPPDFEATLLLANDDLVALAGVYGGHDVRIKHAGISKTLSAWVMIQEGDLNENVGVSFWFDSAKGSLPMGEVMTLSHIQETTGVNETANPFENKTINITLLENVS